MGLSNTAPGLIKVPGQEMEFGKVLKSSIKIVAPNLVAMRIATGFGKKIKKVPERMTKEIKIPIENLWLGPVNTEVGLSKSDSVSVVLTNVDQIVPDLWKKYKEMEQKAGLAMQKRNELKSKNEEYKAEIKELKVDNARLVEKISSIATKVTR